MINFEVLFKQPERKKKLTYHQRYYQKNKEKYRENKKKFYENNKKQIYEKNKEYHRKYYQKLKFNKVLVELVQKVRSLKI